jgi:hypothetical protein
MNILKLKRKIILISAGIILLTGSSFISPMHRFYLSLTEVHVDTKKHTLNISCKMFTDDLETALNKNNSKKIEISGTSKSKELDGLLIDYLNKNFKINVDGKLLKLKYVGFEIENDGIWCYMEVTGFTGKGNVAVYDSLLYDDFPEQSNLVNFYWDEESKSAKLSNPDKMVEFKF